MYKRYFLSFIVKHRLICLVIFSLLFSLNSWSQNDTLVLNNNDKIMSQETILKLLAGASTLAKNSSELAYKQLETAIEAIIKSKYVTREEHENLKKLVLKLEKQLQNQVRKLFFH